MNTAATTASSPPGASGPLAGLRVIDASTILAGPLAAQVLGDFGAEVIKVEHPRLGDGFRTHGATEKGMGLWWRIVSRNKSCITLDLSKPEGAELFVELARTADVVIENFRPGTLERWGIGPEVLAEANPRLVLCRITGFGQDGPYRRRPGFGTLAEAMSGFAALTGEPDGPPTLPPMGLADTLSGLSGVGAVMMALWNRDQPHGSGRGQVIDLSLLEPMMCAVGPGPTLYDRLGTLQPRTGNRSSSNAPRNTYRTSDDRWVAISTSAASIAERVMTMVGRADLVAEPWFGSAAGRVDHVDELDAAVATWISQRTFDDVVAAFDDVDAAVAPIYTAADLLADPQVNALDMVTTVDDDELGSIRMLNVLFRLSDTPGEIRHPGRRLGQDTAEVLEGLGVDAERLAELRSMAVV